MTSRFPARSLFSALGIALSFVSAATLAATKPWVSKEPGGGVQTEQERLQAMKRIIADCTVRLRAGDVAVFLNYPTSNPNYSKAESIISRTIHSCMSSKIGYGASADFSSRDVIFVGLLSQAMMRGFAKPELFVLDESSYDYKRSYMESSNHGNVQKMALCLADIQPDLVIEIISTRPGSPNESRGLTALIPFIGRCLAKGTTLTLGKPELHAVLAEALYHRLVEPITQQQIEAAKAHQHA